MAKVKNLTIALQQGTNNTLYATFEFDGAVRNTTVSTGAVKVGDWVTVKSGATWYNGAAIPSFVFGQEWQVYEVIGTRAVINKNRSGTNSIMSPINVANLQGGSGGGSSSSSTTESISTVQGYEVRWLYQTGNGVWFDGSEETLEGATPNAPTYSPPENARQIKVAVKPVAKTHKVNDEDVAYWTGEEVAAYYSTDVNPPEVPPTPSIEIEDYYLTATVDNISDGRSDQIQFQVYDMQTLFKSATATVSACLASWKFSVNDGGQYRVRARSVNLINGGSVYSDWSDFSSIAITKPSAPTGITTIRGASSTSIYLEWAAVSSAETYEIEYTTQIDYFDASSETTSITGIEGTHYTITGLESGDEYFFRVRAVNDQGESGWTEIKSVTIGKKPSAPTTWSSATTVITGETLRLYWVHNAEDNSKETYAEVEITVGNGQPQTYTIENPTADDDEAEETTKYYEVNTSSYAEGTKIQWRVRTAGITKQYGDWSIMRSVDIYAPPTLNLSLTNQNGSAITTLTEFPFFIKGVAGPNTQAPIGYHVSITANSGYQTVDSVGRDVFVNAGEEVFSQYVDTTEVLLLEMSANNIDLQDGITYTVSVVVSMNSGLTAMETAELDVSWTDEIYILDAEMAVDTDTYTAYITPFCQDEDNLPVTDVTLAVYRREFDGAYVELAKGIETTANTTVTDPHPALDYARYRIVATSKTTGAVSYYDPPGYPMGKPTPVVIQWDEEWTDFDVSNTDERTQPVWNGSMLKLFYNIDVSDNVSTDVSLVNYAGRKYPVSYYGTAIDSTSSWSVEIPATDKETIYALRRLQNWQGDCYVREPSGSGYWANVVVSFQQTHQELTIPITFDITRVEGGV